MHFVSFVAFTIFSLPSVAFACSCAWTTDHQLWVGGDNTTPVNSGGILYRADYPYEYPVVSVIRDGDPSDFTVNRLEDARLGWRHGFFVIRPTDWEVGAKYHVVVQGVPERSNTFEPTYQTLDKTIEVTPAVTALDVSFKVEKTRIRDVSLATGASCARTETAATREISITPNSGWFDKDLLYFRTYVDDETYSPRTSLCQRVPPGGSWVGRGVDMLYEECGEKRPSRFKSVRMEAFIPGTTIRFEGAVDATVACPEGPIETTVEMLKGDLSYELRFYHYGALMLLLILVGLVVRQLLNRNRA